MYLLYHMTYLHSAAGHLAAKVYHQQRLCKEQCHKQCHFLFWLPWFTYFLLQKYTISKDEPQTPQETPLTPLQYPLDSRPVQYQFRPAECPTSSRIPPLHTVITLLHTVLYTDHFHHMQNHFRYLCRSKRTICMPTPLNQLHTSILLVNSLTRTTLWKGICTFVWGKNDLIGH